MFFFLATHSGKKNLKNNKINEPYMSVLHMSEVQKCCCFIIITFHNILLRVTWPEEIVISGFGFQALAPLKPN